MLVVLAHENAGFNAVRTVACQNFPDVCGAELIQIPAVQRLARIVKLAEGLVVPDDFSGVITDEYRHIELGDNVERHAAEYALGSPCGGGAYPPRTPEQKQHGRGQQTERKVNQQQCRR